MPVCHKKLRRAYEAAKRDRKPQRFFEDIEKAIEEKELKPSDFSVRELFEEFVEDGREIVRSWNPRHGGAGAVSLFENAIDTAAFSNISGQIVYNALMEPLQREENVFTNLIPTVPTDLNGEKIAGISTLGNDSFIVNEKEPYPIVGLSEDWIRTPETIKRGVIVPLTKEAIFFDRTGILIQHASQVGDVIAISKEMRAIDALIDENRTAHRYNWRDTSYQTFQASAPWVNVKTGNALVDHTDIEAAEQILNAIIDPWTGLPVMVNATHMICVMSLEPTAKRILNATEVRHTTGSTIETAGANPVANKYQIATSKLLASRLATDTDWFLTNPSAQCAYMENWPATVTQAPPNSEAEFERDIAMQWKISERGEYTTKEPRVAVRSSN